MAMVNILILSQHAEEAAFHWLLRDQAVRAPKFSLRTLRLLEDRLEGHLDGLRVSGDTGWVFCRDELAREGPGEVFTAAVLAFESGESARIGEVLAVATRAPQLTRAFVAALGWLPWGVLQPHLEVLGSVEGPLARRAAAAAWAVQRKDPGARLNCLLADKEVVVRARALRAVGELGRRDLLTRAQSSLTDSDESCRFWAAFSVVLLGGTTALDEVRAIAEAEGPFAEPAALLGARAMSLDDALAWQRQLASYGRRLRLSVQVAGAIGDPALMPWLLERMEESPLARIAGEAFTMITGIDLDYHDLERKWPEGFEAGPNDNPSEDTVSMDPDGNLPFPDPSLLSAWWARNGDSFQPGVRHLAGKPIAPAALEEVLRNGRQRLRAAAALELTLQQAGRPLFEVRASALRQRAALGM